MVKSDNNSQAFSGIGNPSVTVNASQQEKPIDPLQMIAFDSARKVDKVGYVLGFLCVFILVSTCAMGYFHYEAKLTARAQYDKMRYLNKEFNETLEVLKNRIQELEQLPVQSR